MTTKLYWFAIAAVRFSDDGLLPCTTTMMMDTIPITVCTDDYGHARDEAMAKCKKRYPPSERWTGHTVEGVLA